MIGIHPWISEVVLLTMYNNLFNVLGISEQMWNYGHFCVALNLFFDLSTLELANLALYKIPDSKKEKKNMFSWHNLSLSLVAVTNNWITNVSVLDSQDGTLYAARGLTSDE